MVNMEITATLEDADTPISGRDVEVAEVQDTHGQDLLDARVEQ